MQTIKQNLDKRYRIQYIRDGEIVFTQYRDEKPMIKECQEGAVTMRSQTFQIIDTFEPQKFRQSTFNEKKKIWISKIVDK